MASRRIRPQESSLCSPCGSSLMVFLRLRCGGLLYTVREVSTSISSKIRDGNMAVHTDVLDAPAASKARRTSLVRRLENAFERLLWASRLTVLAAVASSLLIGFAMFYIGTVDVIRVLRPLSEYAQVSPV